MDTALPWFLIFAIVFTIIFIAVIMTLVLKNKSLAIENRHLSDLTDRLNNEKTALCASIENEHTYTRSLEIKLAALESESQHDKEMLKETNSQNLDYEAKINDLTENNQRLQIIISEQSARLEFQEKHKAKIEEENAIRFKALAAEILQQNSDTLKSQHESRLTELLSPLRDNIEQFKRTFAESYEKESRERFALDKHIQELVSLNQNIGKEAQELSRALRGNSKVQGDWGEMILETILEKSGLEKGREFIIQESAVSDDGTRLRADVVINYPDGRCAVIDSKVSLTDYIRYVNSENYDEQKICLSAHTASVRKHIDELKNKNYQDYIGSRKADFVMMFIPNESAYIAAMQHDSNLWQYAYDNRVVVISPTHLISVLKLLEQLWQHDRQNRNAVDIAKKAGAMYDKFVGFLTDMMKIRRAIDSASAAYEDSIKKLDTGKGSLIKSAKSLKEMGAKSSRSLPEQFCPDNED